MKISINQSLIKRNKLISQVVLYTAIGLIAFGLMMSLSNPNSAQVFLSYLVLVPAYVLMQINVFMTNKWGRKPRVDEVISNSLKGLDNKYSLYHYTTPISHLLVGPAGVWIIKPYHQYGIIAYDEKKGKFTQKGGGNFLTKIIAMDSISDVNRESKQLLSSLERYFDEIGIKDYPVPQVANIFYHPEAKVQAQNAPEPTISAEKLKDLIRQRAKKSSMNDKVIEKIQGKLPETE